MENFDNEVEKAVSMIKNFEKGFMSCIEQVHEWNGGKHNPCHLDLYNKLLSMEDEIKTKASELLI